MSAIDSGTGQPIKNPSQQAATNEQDEKRTTENVNTASTWWFASTACPLLAATFGPIANGFSVCALGCAWRAYIPDGKADKDGKPINDPGWLLVVNAISLVSALVGNAALLLNMARRMKFSLAQPITIAGFLLAGILLIADMVALTVNPHDWIKQPDARAAKNHALTSAFYFAIFAAIIYIIIGLLMCFTVYGANKRYYPREFNLTPPQRTLMLQTMAFVMYLLICSLVFSRIEEWSYLDTVYWADVTLLTVGLGDMKPKSGYGRGLIIPFAIGGILMVGIVVGSIRSLVLERGLVSWCRP
jgi:potassium channel subfamily K